MDSPAKKFVAGPTLEEIINVTTGIDICGPYVGNPPSRLERPLSPRVPARRPLYVDAFPVAINAAATCGTVLIEVRGKVMGADFRGKGVNAALGPLTNMGTSVASYFCSTFIPPSCCWPQLGLRLGPVPLWRRHCRNYRRHPSLNTYAGVAIANEQEHFRGDSKASQIYSSNFDDKAFHDLYLWPFAEAIQSTPASAPSCFVRSEWARRPAALAGLDLTVPGFSAYDRGPQTGSNPDTAINGWWGANLIEMVKNGSVPEAKVDDMIVRTFAAYYKLGQDFPRTCPLALLNAR
ncbi:hypothetical protein B0H19DRAFT_1234301 [Mycena capillaripes]|nr:hypothetical protein B0H19DRAFT_1234301 [Mycena capillaripes]